MKHATLRAKIERKQAQHARLEQRIGELMSQRADVEGELGELLKKQAAMAPENQPGATERRLRQKRARVSSRGNP